MPRISDTAPLALCPGRLLIYDKVSHLLDERVEEDDALVLEHAVEVGVGVGRAARPVHDEDLGQGERHLV